MTLLLALFQRRESNVLLNANTNDQEVLTDISHQTLPDNSTSLDWVAMCNETVTTQLRKRLETCFQKVHHLDTRHLCHQAERLINGCAEDKMLEVCYSDEWIRLVTGRNEYQLCCIWDI